MTRTVTLQYENSAMSVRLSSDGVDCNECQSCNAQVRSHMKTRESSSHGSDLLQDGFWETRFVQGLSKS